MRKKKDEFRESTVEECVGQPRLSDSFFPSLSFFSLPEDFDSTRGHGDTSGTQEEERESGKKEGREKVSHPEKGLFRPTCGFSLSNPLPLAAVIIHSQLFPFFFSYFFPRPATTARVRPDEKVVSR